MKGLFFTVIFLLLFGLVTSAQQESSYRGVYVNRFDKLLEDTGDSRIFLQWAQRNGIRHFSCYDLYTILSRRDLTERLVSFMRTARQQYGVLSFDAVASSAGFLIEKVYPFNLAHRQEGLLFSFNLEREWWTEEVSFRSHRQNMQQLRTFIRDSSMISNLSLETYIGWFGLTHTSSEAEAMSLVQYADLIAVSAYQKHLHFTYLRSRLEELAKAAAECHKKQDIVIIFSMEKEFAGKQSKKKSYQEMYDQLMKEYEHALRSGEVDPLVAKQLNIKGWKVFAQSYARQYRP